MLIYKGKATNHSTVTEAMRHRKGPAKGAHTQIHKHAVKTHSQTRQSRTKLPNSSEGKHCNTENRHSHCLWESVGISANTHTHREKLSLETPGGLIQVLISSLMGLAGLVS